MKTQRRYVILAEGRFGPLESKTANQVIRYLPEQVTGVIDSTKAGRTAQEVLGFGGAIPVHRDILSSLAGDPDTLLIGVAPTGGRLPESWRPIILGAIEHGLNIVSGLHTILSEDGEFRRRAAERSVSITDLRKVPPEYEVVSRGSWKTRKARTILTVGTDCNVGKMTASLELHREFERRGLRSAFVPTGQTGMLLAGGGVAVDSIVSDYVAGSIELEVDRAVSSGSEYVHVEGQGSLTHQGYSAVTLGLMHGVMPDAMVLVHHPGRSVDAYGLPLEDVGRFIALHEMILSPFKTSRVVGIAVNAVGMTRPRLERSLNELERRTGLPAADVLSGGAGKLADALLTYLQHGT